MRSKKYYIIIFIIASVFAVKTTTGESLRERRQDQKEIRQAAQELRNTKVAFDQLICTIDLWHDANLKQDNKMIRKYEATIFELIRTDLASSRRVVQQHEAEVHRSAREYNQPHNTRAGRRDDRNDLHDDVQDTCRASQLLKRKEHLAASLFRATAFSNKYRLLDDYAEVLRCELGMNRTEIAEDVHEIHEDWVEGP